MDERLEKLIGEVEHLKKVVKQLIREQKHDQKMIYGSST